MNVDLQTKIVESWRRLKALDQERAEVLGHLYGYVEELVASRSGTSDASLESQADIKLATERLSSSWKFILSNFSSSKYFNATEIERFVHREYEQKSAGKLKLKKQKAANIRTQLSLFVRKGIVRRFGNGRYVVSPETKQVLKISGKTIGPGVVSGPRAPTAGDAR